jgi:hypothetical protein
MMAQPQIHCMQLLVNMRFRSVHLPTPDDGLTIYIVSSCCTPNGGAPGISQAGLGYNCTALQIIYTQWKRDNMILKSTVTV